MTTSLILLVAVAALIAAGVTLLLERSLVRILVGIIVAGNGVNLLILTVGGPGGQPPIKGRFEPDRMADPLAQALVLTAIVITLGVTAYLLALAHRTWQLVGDDTVQDDTEDRRVRLAATRGDLIDSVVATRERYRAILDQQERELAELAAESRRRVEEGEAELEQQILAVNVDLGRWMEDHRNAGLSPEELMARFEEARRLEESSKQDLAERERELRQRYAARRREQEATERQARRKIQARARQARKEMRHAIREDRRRQALALDPEMEGQDD
ncbi:Na(+)/H(+) antiporter subunit C [Nonomuraea sp. NPDC050310]|uniref:Na(+)/H(+) antiporter subunit C n=1 Tax=unclassified Nonomuraea TaxID=2593643 RepID=UPI0033E96E35